MILVIKGKQYDNPNWMIQNGIGELRIHSDADFAQITADFALVAGDSIVQLNDNEEQIGQWYVEGMASIQLPGEDGSDVVTIKYHVSQLGKDAQEAIKDDLDMTSMSVLELAGIVATAKKNMNDTAERVEQAQKEQKSQISTIQQLQNQMNESISRWETMYNTLADRVARLENK